MPDVSRGPGIPFPPPFVYAAAYAIAALLNRRLEFLIDGRGAGHDAVRHRFRAHRRRSRVDGLRHRDVSARAHVRRARSARAPARTWGPYGLSRNPMYVGITSVYLGIAIVNNHAWPLVLLPLPDRDDRHHPARGDLPAHRLWRRGTDQDPAGECAGGCSVRPRRVGLMTRRTHA